MRRPRWASYLPEALLIAMGLLIRASFLGNTDASSTYDYLDHVRYLEWFQTHLAPAPLSLSRTSYGAPLYYLLGGLALRCGASLKAVADASIVCGGLRLVVIAVGLEQFLPSDRIARRSALLLAAVLPAAVHIDGMINPESLHMLLASSALLPWAAFRRDGRTGLKAGVLSGTLIGLALWTKISSLVLLPAVAIGAAASKVNGSAVKPWLVTATVAAAVASPWYVHTISEYGMLAPTAFEAGDRAAIGEDVLRTPLFRRRPASFYFGLSAPVLGVPHAPAASGKFFPTLLSSTFADYYLYNFTPRHQEGSTFELSPHGCGLSRVGELLAGVSVAAGVLIVLTTLLGLIVLVLRRRAELLALAALGIGAVAAQLLFALKYPVDHYGVIKGTYLQFAAFPLFLAYGMAISFLWSRPGWEKATAMVSMVAALLVATYTIASRAALV